MSDLTQFQINSMRRDITVEVVGETMTSNATKAQIEAEVDRRLSLRIEAASRTSWEPPSQAQIDANINHSMAIMNAAIAPPAPAAPAATYQPPAPRAESPRLPAGIFPAPPGSKIHPDGKIRTLDGRTFTPCSASGVKLHMNKSEPYTCPDWVCCKPDP